jgi:hypothetical protein
MLTSKVASGDIGAGFITLAAAALTAANPALAPGLADPISAFGDVTDILTKGSAKGRAF